MKRTFLTILAVGILSMAAGVWAQEVPQKSAVKEKILAAGQYTAKVKALPCDACAPRVQQILQEFNGIESASVDQKTSTVQFSVKKDAKVKLSEVQKALRASADEMGMGANYELYELTRLAKVEPTADTEKAGTGAGC